MRTGVFRSDNLAFDATLTKAWTNNDACHAVELRGDILGGYVFAVNEMNAHLHIVVDAGQVETLADALVGILQGVFAHQSHMYLALGIALLVEEVVPRLHGRCHSRRSVAYP